MSDALFWPLGLLMFALALLAAEFLIPSAGILGLSSAICFGAAIFIAFGESTAMGFAFLGAAAVMAPFVWAMMVRIWPYTPVGRRMLNLPWEDSESRPPTVDPRMRELRALVGRVGIARTDLLPSGLIEVDGRRYDAVALGAAIDRGSAVEVFNVETGKIRVRRTERRPAPGPEEQPAAITETPLEELDLEDLGDPLA